MRPPKNRRPRNQVAMLRLAMVLAIAVLLAQVSTSVHAQTARSGGAPNAQLMQQMQQLASERTALQAENGRIKKELEDIRKERDQLKSAQKALEARAQASNAALARGSADRESHEKEVTQLKGKITEIVAKFREVVESMRTVETEGTKAKQQLASRDQELKVCVDRNTQLMKLNDEILAKSDHPGAVARLARAEPFTQLGRIQHENRVDELRDRAADLRVPSPAALPPEALAPLPQAPDVDALTSMTPN